MCNRFVQKGREVRPGQRALVLMRGPGGEFEVPFDEAVFGGPARNESRHYWLKREGAEPVLVPDISRFGEKDEATQEQKPGRRARFEQTPPEGIGALRSKTKDGTIRGMSTKLIEQQLADLQKRVEKLQATTAQSDETYKGTNETYKEAYKGTGLLSRKIL